MNNYNGAALLARIRTGMRVTLRTPDGNTKTCRAIVTHTGRYLTRDGRGHECELRANDIIMVRA